MPGGAALVADQLAIDPGQHREFDRAGRAAPRGETRGRDAEEDRVLGRGKHQPLRPAVDRRDQPGPFAGTVDRHLLLLHSTVERRTNRAANDQPRAVAGRKPGTARCRQRHSLRQKRSARRIVEPGEPAERAEHLEIEHDRRNFADARRSAHFAGFGNGLSGEPLDRRAGPRRDQRAQPVDRLDRTRAALFEHRDEAARRHEQPRAVLYRRDPRRARAGIEQREFADHFARRNPADRRVLVAGHPGRYLQQAGTEYEQPARRIALAEQHLARGDRKRRGHLPQVFARLGAQPHEQRGPIQRICHRPCPSLRVASLTRLP